MITGLGHNTADTWAGMIEGRPGIRRITLFDPSGYDSQVAGEVQDFDPASYMDRKEARRADRVTQFGFVAAAEALKQAGYDPSENGAEMAVVIGTAIGGISTLMEEYDTLLAKGPGRVSPFLMPMMLSPAPAAPTASARPRTSSCGATRRSHSQGAPKRQSRRSAWPGSPRPRR
jgi:3-oxoacyl-[acyl-carrier-protein] synthase II